MPPTGQPAGIDFSNLSDVELTQMLKDYGVDVGPVNLATRKTYERKLMKLKTGVEPPTSRYQTVDDDDEDDNEVTTRRPEPKIVATKRTTEQKVVITKSDVATSPMYRPVRDIDDEDIHVRRPDLTSRPSPSVYQPSQPQLRRGKESEYTPRVESRPSLLSNRAPTAAYSTPLSRTNPTKQLPQEKSKGTPMWLKVLIVVVVVVLLYLIYANMEPQAKSNIPGIQNKVEV